MLRDIEDKKCTGLVATTWTCPPPEGSKNTEGRTITMRRHVVWHNTAQPKCEGRIVKVEEREGGKVMLLGRP